LKKKLYILLLFQTLILSAFGITVTTTAPNTGVSKVMTVDNGKVYELNFNTDVLSSSKVEVNIKELGSTIASQQISTNGNHELTFTPTSNAITIEFNRINSGTASLKFEVDNIQLKEVVSSRLTHEVGTKNYELSDHLGNVRTSVSDKKVSGSSKVISANDYYPFGMEARSVFSSEYRYGFNRLELEREFNNSNSIIDYESRLYNNRLGKFLKIDVKWSHYPSHSPYSYAVDNPVRWIDQGGFGADDGKLHANVVKIKVTTNQGVKIIYLKKNFYENLTKEQADDWDKYGANGWYEANPSTFQKKNRLIKKGEDGRITSTTWGANTPAKPNELSKNDHNPSNINPENPQGILNIKVKGKPGSIVKYGIRDPNGDIELGSIKVGKDGTAETSQQFGLKEGQSLFVQEESNAEITEKSINATTVPVTGMKQYDKKYDKDAEPSIEDVQLYLRKKGYKKIKVKDIKVTK